MGQFFEVKNSLQRTNARTEQFMGRTFRVVPAVLVRSQVLKNNLGATLLPAEEITQEWAELWNNIPVLVGPHPNASGSPISGRDPSLINERGAGWIFNAKAEQESPMVRRLVAEVWLDESRADAVPGLRDALNALDSGQPVELSTGFNVRLDQITGMFQGEPFDMVLRPTAVDHLVISTEMTGACSVRDGCGLSVNERGDNMTVASNDRPTQSVDGEAHPASDFACVPDPQTSSTWKLPIFDAAHVRAAISRFNQTDMPAGLRRKAWKKVMAAARRFGIEVSDTTMPAQSWLERAVEILGVRAEHEEHDAAEQWSEGVSQRLAREAEAMNAVPQSDQDKHNMLQSALQDKFGGSDKSIVVEAIYSDDKAVVFWMTTPFGPQPPGPEYFRVQYTEGDNGACTFGEPEKVVRRTLYEPAQNSAEANNTNPGKPCGCRKGESTMPMSEQEKKDLVNEMTTAIQAAVKPVSDSIATIATEAKTAATHAVNEVKTALEASITALKGQVETLQQTVNAERDSERTALVQHLSANAKTKDVYTAADLESMNLEQLRKVATLAGVEVTNYAGRGAPRAVNAAADSDAPQYAAPVAYFEKKEN